VFPFAFISIFIDELRICLSSGVISTFSKHLCCILVMRVDEVGKIIKGRFSEVFIIKEMPTTYKRKQMTKRVDGNSKIWKVL
jgi:hypothetical protein